MSKPDPGSWTLLFKKHKTTVLLMLPPHESITTAKEILLKALNSRGLKAINGDPIPGDTAEVEFGVAVDKNNLDKGWTKLDVEESTFGKERRPSSTRNGTAAAKRNNSASATSLQAADLRNGQPIAFRFRKRREEAEENQGDREQPDLDNIGLEFDDPGWDVVVPSLDDEMEETS